MANDTTEHGKSSGKDQRKLVDERWDEIKSALKTQWPVLTTEDLNMIDGDSRKLVALVHQKTHMPLHEIEEGIDAIAAKSNGLLSRLLRSTSEFTESAREQVEAAARTVSEPVVRVAAQARRMVEDRPLPSIGTVFAAGFLLGMLAYRLTSEE